jgi:predicted DNA-binding transcriptional regulator AlpA
MNDTSRHVSPEHDLIGVSEIGRRHDVPTNTAWRWTLRDDFPEPAVKLGTGRGSRRAWRAADVDEWASEHLPLPGDRRSATARDPG